MEKYQIKDTVIFGDYKEVEGLQLRDITNDPKDDEVLDGILLYAYESKFTRTNFNFERYTKEALDDFIKEYFIANGLNMPLTCQHRSDRENTIGKVLVLEVNTQGYYFVCYIPKGIFGYDDIKIKIKAGILQGLSKEGWATDYEWKKNTNGDEYVEIRKFELESVSLVSLPANALRLEKAKEVQNRLQFENKTNKKTVDETDEWFK